VVQPLRRNRDDTAKIPSRTTIKEPASKPLLPKEVAQPYPHHTLQFVAALLQPQRHSRILDVTDEKKQERDREREGGGSVA
jgi:hypothetical protein